ncbi:MAG: hypothetical protein LBN42_00675 [Oscillospiraceae bacterium]|jgi:hypothetical protein|nr:hypothetical protein [Oscillospiraceae bacterium]
MDTKITKAKRLILVWAVYVTVGLVVVLFGVNQYVKTHTYDVTDGVRAEVKSAYINFAHLLTAINVNGFDIEIFTVDNVPVSISDIDIAAYNSDTYNTIPFDKFTALNGVTTVTLQLQNIMLYDKLAVREIYEGLLKFDDIRYAVFEKEGVYSVGIYANYKDKHKIFFCGSDALDGEIVYESQSKEKFWVLW